jgi:virginiamycin B lyase
MTIVRRNTTMRRDKPWRLTLVLASAIAAISSGIAASHLENPLPEHAGDESALTGQVKSADEGLMEGVLVSAKKDGSTITTTVVSDEHGRYRFPSAKLGSGHYTLKIRAAGYELEGPKSAEVGGARGAVADLHLKKTDNLVPQLTDAEWLLSVPGTENQKKQLLGCTNCHTLERTLRSTYDAAAMKQVLERMAGYANQSFPLHPQRRVSPPNLVRRFGAGTDDLAAYIATINQSSGPWKYGLKTLPRPAGRATQAIITEFDLPRNTIEPHDVIVDQNGAVWFSNFGEQSFGKLDPKSGKITEYPVPLVRPGFPTGMLDLETDANGSLWLAMMYQGGIARFDKKTETFKIWQVPPELTNAETQQSMVGPQHWDVDGKVWLNDVGIPGVYRMDLETGKFERWEPYKELPPGPHSVYGIYADSRNNLFFLDFGGENVGKIDAKTGKLTLFPTPTPRSRPRRGRMDSQDRLWFGEFYGGKIGMFDTRSEQFKEWSVPTPYTAPYDVVLDKNGEVWGAGMEADRIMRMNPATGEIIEYLLPNQTNIRRVFVDNSTTPVTFWVGNNEAASIIKLEPR